MQWLEGKKTYIVGVAGTLLAIVAAWYGVLTVDASTQIVIGCLGMMGLRSGLTSEVSKAVVERAADEGAKHRAGTCIHCDQGRLLDNGVHHWSTAEGMRSAPCQKLPGRKT